MRNYWVQTKHGEAAAAAAASKTFNTGEKGKFKL